MLVVDTGIFVAVADRDEPHHSVSVEALRGHRDVAVPAPVIPETAWLTEARLGPDAEVRFLTAVTGPKFQVVVPIPADYVRAVELIRRYADLGLGLVDASIIASAERLGATTIATIDQATSSWAALLTATRSNSSLEPPFALGLR